MFTHFPFFSFREMFLYGALSTDAHRGRYGLENLTCTNAATSPLGKVIGDSKCASSNRNTRQRIQQCLYTLLITVHPTRPPSSFSALSFGCAWGTKADVRSPTEVGNPALLLLRRSHPSAVPAPVWPPPAPEGWEPQSRREAAPMRFPNSKKPC